MSAYVCSFFEERRINKDPVPADLQNVLTSSQMTTLTELESLEWFLLFVRRLPGEPAIPFLIDASLSSVAVIDKDGEIKREHGLPYRLDIIY